MIDGEDDEGDGDEEGGGDGGRGRRGREEEGEFGGRKERAACLLTALWLLTRTRAHT